MKFAYADPPYLGLARLYADMHPESGIWDDPETHRAFICRLSDEYPDGWVLSLHTPSLRTILPMCPDDVRVGSWVKPFASFKPGVPVAYAWEPVIFRGGRRRSKSELTTRDWVAFLRYAARDAESFLVDFAKKRVGLLRALRRLGFGKLPRRHVLALRIGLEGRAFHGFDGSDSCPEHRGCEQQAVEVG